MWWIIAVVISLASFIVGYYMQGISDVPVMAADGANAEEVDITIMSTRAAVRAATMQKYPGCKDKEERCKSPNCEKIESYRLAKM